MSVVGDLSDFDPGDLISVIGLLGKSGKLRLTCGESEGMVVFRGGKIIYAASSSFRENLGSMLLSRNLVDEAQLIAALEHQHKSVEEKRLGNILLEMGVLTEDALGEVIHTQFLRVFSEFIEWCSGEFRFDSMEVADHGEVELPATDLLAPFGISPDGVLLEAAQQVDEEGLMNQTVEKTPVPEPATSRVSLKSIATEIRSPEFKGETLQQLMHLAETSFHRGVLFSARKDRFRPIAHFGVRSDGKSAENPTLDFVVPRQQPGILSRSAESKRTILATLPSGPGDEGILEALVEPTATKSVASPLVVLDEVVLVLYGDRIRDDLRTGWIETLEGHLGELAQAIQADIARELSVHAKGVGAR